MINAKRAVGAPPPGGKQKYAVQSMSYLARIKHLLAELASAFSEKEYNARNQEYGFRFAFLGTILLESALQDAVLARDWAIGASLTRQALLNNVLAFRSQLLLFRHTSAMRTVDIGTNLDRREELYRFSETMKEESHGQALACIQNRIDPVFLENPHEIKWLEGNVVAPLAQLLDDWSTLCVAGSIR